MLSQILQIFGVLLISKALRSARHPHWRRLGTLALYFASFLIGFYLTGHWQIGLFCAASWLVIPFWRVLGHIWRARFPMEGLFRASPPHFDHRFPELREGTAALEEAGFEEVDDLIFEWGGNSQHIRLFAHPGESLVAVICAMGSPSYMLVFVRLISRGADGRAWMTTNYPFRTNLKVPPQYHYQHQPRLQEIPALLAEHLRRVAQAKAELLPPQLDQLRDDFIRDFEAQIAHNLHVGVLLPAGEGTLRYSWRGLFFVWRQLLRDSFRLAL